MSDYRRHTNKVTEERLAEVTERSLGFFRRQLKENGQVANYTDLAEYSKLPNALIYGGYPTDANRVLNFMIDTMFDEKTGDFRTRKGLKSWKSAFDEFYIYCNAWIVQSLLMLRRFDIAYKAASFLDRYYNTQLNACTIRYTYGNSPNGQNMHCVFNTAALGLTYLSLGYVDRALKFGDRLLEQIERQPDMDKGIFYQIFDDNGNFKTDENEMKDWVLFCVNGNRVKQSWWSIGYPAAYLGILYRVTKNKKYLDGAECILDFAINKCNDDIRNNAAAHKVMWASSILGEITNKQKYWNLCFDIANHIMLNQDPVTGKTSPVVDQVAEMAFWFPIVSMNMKTAKRKYGKLGVGKSKL
eukprot:339796_1